MTERRAAAPDSARRAIATEHAPHALGPYSQAVRAGDLVFCSGQIGLDPATGSLVPGGIADETRRVLENLRAVLAAAGVDCGAVVRTTVYRVNLSDFPIVNQVYAEFFPAPSPARSTVQVTALPREARVEIDAIAVVPAPAPGATTIV
jgi:2-iminobutanoate/2-iminopropanoate deaminase